MDCDTLFVAAKRALPKGWLHHRFGRGAWLYENLFGVWTAQPDGEGFWSPRPAKASSEKHLVLVIAVRTGDPWISDFGLPAWIDVDPVHRTPTAEGMSRLRGSRALFGPDIVDLLACDLTLTKPPRRMTGMARALGYGAAGEYTTTDDGPVPIVRTVLEWLAHSTDGACLPLGSSVERAELLRGFGGGVTAMDLAHGETLQRLMKREPIQNPEIFLTQATA